MSLLKLHELQFGVNPRTPLSLTIYPGERWVILGQNGAGKSSLLHTLLGLTPPSHGQIYLNEAPLFHLSRQKRAQTLGLVLQENHCALPLSVNDYLEHAFYPYPSLTPHEKTNRKSKVLAYFALPPTQMINTLSGGERKRAALAALFLQDPLFYVMDEPCNHLDLKHQQQLFSALRERTDRGVVLTLHDLHLTEQIATHVLLLFEDGSHFAGSKADGLTEALLSRLYQHNLKQYRHEAAVFWEARICHTQKPFFKEDTHEH